jgi:hypothetical protein
MKVELLFPSRYLKAADLKGPTPLTIEAVTVEDIRTSGGKEKRPIVYFKERTDKALVLNKTNALVIAMMHGGETDDWAGKPIVLIPARVPFGNKIVEAIRVQEQSQ